MQVSVIITQCYDVEGCVDFWGDMPYIRYMEENSYFFTLRGQTYDN